MSSAIDPETLRAWHETDYVVDDDPPLVLRIGERNDGLRILFASFNAESAAFITAWNPGGELASEDQNHDRQADLLAEIEQLRLNYFVGRGEHPASGRVEDSYLVLGITQDQATALARQFGQLGYVWIPISGVPEIVVLD